MPTLDDVRSMQAQFETQRARLVLAGTGDPNPLAGMIGSVYRDLSVTPVVVWVKQRSGWEKVSHGATE